MKDLFEKIKKADCDKKQEVLNVLDGEFFAEKALVSDGEVIWESQPDGFFSSCKEEIKVLTDGGEVSLAGQKVFCDVVRHNPEIVICGGGHVSIPVIMLGVMMGMEVTVLEDRPLFADHARSAGATRVICEPFAEGLKKVPGSLDTFFVIVTRGHRYDQICLEMIAQKKHAYIGMIGSRKRTRLVKEILAEKGVDQAVLDAVYAPIGLDIKAETPVEIAVAIMAEIIQVKNQKASIGGYPKEIVKAVTQTEGAWQGGVLATIVSRKGSAPRGVGTKMLIFPDGTCIGTIGGGCMEANVVQKARLMCAEKKQKAQICQIDMTGGDAEEEGMVCGGVICVLLEIIDE